MDKSYIMGFLALSVIATIHYAHMEYRTSSIRQSIDLTDKFLVYNEKHAYNGGGDKAMLSSFDAVRALCAHADIDPGIQHECAIRASTIRHMTGRESDYRTICEWLRTLYFASKIPAVLILITAGLSVYDRVRNTV